MQHQIRIEKKTEAYIDRYLKCGVWKSTAHVIKYAIPCLPFSSISWRRYLEKLTIHDRYINKRVYFLTHKTSVSPE